MPAEQLLGRVTGIGSLPHTAPVQALDLIFTYLKEVPHWPQLPRRSPREGLVAQYINPLLERGLVAADERNTPCFQTKAPLWEERCLEMYELFLAAEQDTTALEAFAMPAGAAAGFYAFLEAAERLPQEAVLVKGQVSGPVTVGFQVLDEQGRPAFYNDTLRELLVNTLAVQACWQARRLREIGRGVLIFIDDPGLYSYGSSTAVGLGRQEIQDSLRIMVDALRAAGTLVGAHCCAGADWSLLLELPLDVVSFDAYTYLSSMRVYIENLNAFLERGGALAWGIVPTSPEVMAEDAHSLAQRLEEGMSSLIKGGAKEERLRKQMLITPSCGAGTLTVEAAERVYRLAAALRNTIQ